MRRFFLTDFPKTPGQTVFLPKEILHHLKTVLRQSGENPFELFDGHGCVARCQLSADGEQAEIQQVHLHEKQSCQIELIQALAKGEKLEWILQKGTELGLSDFIFTATERTVVKLSKTKQENRLNRWEKIIQEAARQCGQTFIPGLRASGSLHDALAISSGQLKLMLWEEASTPLRISLPQTPPTRISILVGPEGGFSAAEAQQAMTEGFQPVRLGPRILRTETAGLAILSILQYVYGDLD